MKVIAAIAVYLVAAARADSLEEELEMLPRDESWGIFGNPNTTEGEYQLVVIGGGHVANNMPGWINSETAGSRFFDIPESQLLNTAFVPKWHILSGSYMRFWCADHPSVKKCDIYINIYKCNGCEAGLNVDFRNYLTTNGWTPTACGPKFISDEGEESHKFMTFRKQVPSGHLERVEIVSDVKLMFASMRSDGVDCSEFSLVNCESSERKQCRVINGECVDDWCPRMFQGPCIPPCGTGRCENCALEEAAFQSPQ